jgi:hypothetical protein
MDAGQENSPAQGARLDLAAMTRDRHGALKARPNHPVSTPTLTRLGSRKRAVEKAIKEHRHVQPEVFASLLELAPDLTDEEKFQYVSKYTAALMAVETEKCLQILQRALQRIGPDGETITIIDYETHISIHGRSISVNRTSSGTIGNQEAQREFTAAQGAMARGTTFGWITSVGPGFQITAPSRTICGLLDLGYDELNGSFLLADPLLSRLQTMLANFGEWVLIIAMLTHSALAGWRSDPRYAHTAAEVGRFFEWLKWYVRADYKRIAEQVERAPVVLVDGDSSRNDLRQCIGAATGDAEWPPYNTNRHNTMRMYVEHHPMLPDGVARFEKTARPFYSGGQVLGYEVTWNAEYADEVANRLMRGVLAELGLVERHVVAP